jgi:vancomycin permeability regulator SanA
LSVTLRSRHPRLLILLLVVAVVLTPLAASAIAVWRAAHTDEASEVDNADVILVLGAAQYGGEPSPIFKGRLDHGILLYEQGFADRIMVLGAGQQGDQFTEAEAGVMYLVDSGIPFEAVDASPEGSTTFESLRGAARRMEEAELGSAFLVSDPWHNLRIRRMARDLGIEGYVSATWHSAARSQTTRFQGYARETFAYIYYRIFGA